MVEGVAARTYQLVVEGDLDPELDRGTEDFTLTRTASTTTLTARVRDQAELQGLLQHVCRLGLTLLELNAIDETETPASG